MALTPVSVEKSKSTRAKKKNTGFLSFLGNPATQAVFGATKLFTLPDDLYGDPLQRPEALTDFIIDCGQQSDMEIHDIIFCPEGDELISKEYQHTVAKKKFINSFAVLEAEPMVPDAIANYSVVSCEYGEEYGKEKQSEMLNAVLYAMRNDLMNNLKTALAAKEIKLARITPPTIALINAAKYDINSVQKTIALISVDCVGMRVVVVNHGAPIYSQYFASPIIEIGEVFARDQGMGIAEAITMLKTNGFKAVDKCFPQTVRQIKDTLETLIAEINRNLRMVLLSQRMELDQVYVCDALASMPGAVDYVKGMNLSEHVDNISVTFQPDNIPVLDSTADGVDISAYYLFNNMLTYCNGIDDSMLIGIGTAKKRNINIGKYLSYAGIGVMALYILAFAGLRIYTSVRRASDNVELNNVKYNTVKSLINERDDLLTNLTNAAEDKKKLPEKTSVYLILEKVSNIISAGGGEMKSINIDTAKNSVNVKFEIGSYSQFSLLRESVINNPEFDVLIPFSSTLNTEKGTYNCEVTLAVNYDGFVDPDAQDESIASSEAQQENTSSQGTESGNTSSAVSSDGGNE